MKKALVFYGGWTGHEPAEVSELFAQMLTEEGFAVTRVDTMACLSDEEELKTYDLIIPLWTMGEIEPLHTQNVCAAVEAGTGLAGCHGGMCDAFRNDVNWQFMTGSQWVAHPGGDGVSYTVNLKGGALTEGLSDFAVSSEQYYIHVDPAVTVHATTRFPTVDGPHAANGPVDVPVVYTKLWGKGRVFYNSLGHVRRVFDIPEAKELMRRGFLWAAR